MPAASAAASRCAASRTRRWCAGRASSPTTCSAPAQTHLVFLRSPHAHARIAVGRHQRGAGACPACWRSTPAPTWWPPASSRWPTPMPFPRPDGTPGASAAAPRAGASTACAIVGEAVAAVVAESREAARDGAEAVLVDYEDLPAVVDALQRDARPARRCCATQAPDNIAAEMHHGDAAATDAAFAARRARGRAGHRQPAPRAQRDGAARRARRARRRQRPADGHAVAARCPPRCATASPPRCPAWPRSRCACGSATSAAASA